MFPKPKNERLAIGTFVSVLAIDAVLGGVSGAHWLAILIVFAVNLPGFLLGSGIAMLFGHGNAESFTMPLIVVGALFSAAFWSYIFGYVFPFKRAA